MKISDEKLEKIKNDTKKFYLSIGKIWCPYLKHDIHFNNEGFEHLLTRSWNRGRSKEEQYTRLRLFPKVVEIIKKCHTLQEYDEKNIFIRQKTNSQWTKKLKLVKYYVFIAISIENDIRLKIIIKHIDGGEPFFWSVYPSWKIKKNMFENKKKIFYKGNLEED